MIRYDYRGCEFLTTIKFLSNFEGYLKNPFYYGFPQKIDDPFSWKF